VRRERLERWAQLLEQRPQRRSTVGGTVNTEARIDTVDGEEE
jgi:hypothetical protein